MRPKGSWNTTFRSMVNREQIQNCSIVRQSPCSAHVYRYSFSAGPDGKLVHKCDCCRKKYFATAEEKEQHKKDVHLDELTCPHCKEECSNRNMLRMHIQNKHQRYTCIKCGRNDDFTRSHCRFSSRIIYFKFQEYRSLRRDCWKIMRNRIAVEIQFLNVKNVANVSPPSTHIKFI